MNLRILCSLLGGIFFSLTGMADVPFITSFTPNFGASNDPTYITITGRGFSNVNLVVKFNGVQDTAAYATLADGSQIQTHVAPGTPKGTGYVFVSVNGVMAPPGNGVYFTVIGPTDPYASDFSPATGNAGGGTVVTINGVHFNGITAVKFNGVTASFSPVTDPTTFTATVPAGAQTGPISIEKTGSATFVCATNFYVSPTITSFSPSSGRVGTNVVIRGTSFTNATAVKFGSVSAPGFNVDSNSQITVAAPSGVATGPITVIAPAGTFITSSNFLVKPTISNFTPGFGPAGTSVTISGANFDAGSFSVTFNGVTATHGTPAFGSVSATAPSSTTGPIVVTTVGGSVTSSASFYYPAFMGGLTPNFGAAGTTVKISGGNFTDATAVTFNGQPAASFVVSNNTTIGAVVPVGVTSGTVNVTTPAGLASNGGFFYGPPAISNFNPTHGLPGDSVQINGLNFLGATAVKFNGTSASSFTVSNNTVIAAMVPAGALSGPITVSTPGGTNTSATAFTLDYSSDLSVLVTNAPNPGVVTGNLVYTITVANNAGPYQALNVNLTNTLPATVVLKSASTTQGTLNTNSNPITASLGTIAVGNSAVITLTVVPQTARNITDTAVVGADTADPNAANNSASNVTAIWTLPTLGIQTLTGNQVKVFWPAPLSNFTLLVRSNLIPLNAAWNTDLTARVLSGTNITVTEPGTGAAKVFRLKQ